MAKAKMTKADMGGLDWMKGEVGFVLNNERIKFTVYHNHPNIPGMKLEEALLNWAVRTTDHSCESFCDYVNKKNSGLYAYTEEQWNKIIEELKNEESEQN